MLQGVNGGRVDGLSRNGSCCRGLHGGDADDAHRTDAALLAGANEVLVGATVAAVLRVHQTAGSARCVTVSAVQEAFEVKEVNAVTVALTVPLVEDRLHSEKHLPRDERFVPSAVQLACVTDDARVVRVA